LATKAAAPPESICFAWSEKGVGLAQKMQVGPCIPWEYSYKRLQLAQLLGKLGVLLTPAGRATLGKAGFGAQLTAVREWTLSQGRRMDAFAGKVDGRFRREGVFVRAENLTC
jgi:hypothetical protein